MNILSDYPMFDRPLINVGATFDIPTGSFLTGAKGEKILNGGLSNIEGVIGTGNNFKSTFMHFLMLQAGNRLMASGFDTPFHTYDTEDNMALNLERINKLAKRFSNIIEEPLYEPSVWSVISKSEMPAEEWIRKVYDLVEAKKKSKDKVTYEAFINKKTKEKLVLPKPSFIEIDSFTELEASSTIDAVEKDISNSNTVFMQQGLFKTKILKDLPRLSNVANIFILLTAHLGKKIEIASGPFAPQPKKLLSYLKADDKIKGVSDKLYFLTTHLWLAFGSRPLINQNTKMPEYPIDENDVETDLNILHIQQLRSKSGPSGYILDVIVSQREGILPSLTEFHFLKTNKFGIDGSPRSYWIELYPDVKLSRTTIRNKIDDDPKLRRAINITSELLQMTKFMPQYKDLYCTPKELYEDIKKMGINWEDILTTRGWWTVKQYDKKLPPFLSTLDLLLLRKNNKKPYWMK